MTEKEIIEILKKSDALLEGHFLLSSGLHSDKYFQMAKVFQYPEYSSLLVNELIKKIDNKIIDEVETIVSPAMGGVIIGYEFARNINKRNIFTERENGKMSLRRGFSLKKGEKVIITEDVITTGGSVKEVIELLKQDYNADILAVVSLVNRSTTPPDFGNIDYFYLLKVQANTYKPEECPMCKSPDKYPQLIKPGSRYLK